MDLATDATNANGNALDNQEKYMDSYNGKLQQLSTQMDAFWLDFYDSDMTKGVLDFLKGLISGFNKLSKVISPLGGMVTTLVGAMTAISTIKNKGSGRAKETFVVIRKVITSKIN